MPDNASSYIGLSEYIRKVSVLNNLRSYIYQDIDKINRCEMAKEQSHYYSHNHLLSSRQPSCL